MKKWTINQLVLTGFLAAVLFLALLAIITWDSMMTSVKTGAKNAHSKAVLVASEKISSSMAMAVAAHRSHMLRTDEKSLLQRDAALEALHTSLANLDELASDDLPLQALVRQLRQMIPERIENMRQAQSHLGTEQVLPYLDADDAHNERMLSILSRIAVHETQLQQNYDNMERNTMRRAQTSAAVLLVFLALLLSGLYLLIYRHAQQDASRMELQRSEALLRQILGLLPVGVMVVGRDSTLDLVNPAAHDIWGTSPGEALEVPHSFSAWHADTGSKVEHREYGVIRALRHGEITLNREYEILRPDGQRRIVRSSSMPLRDSEQQIIGAITVNMDLTDLKRAEKALQAAHDALEARVAMRTRELVVANAQLKSQIEERRRAEDALRQTQNVLTIAQRVAHVGSWEINLATQEAQWSDEFFRICGLEPGAVKPTIPAGFALIHPDDRRMISAVVNAAVAERREYSATVRVVRPDGSLRHVRLQGEPVPSGDAPPIILIGSMLDITEHKQNEEMLRQLAVHQEFIKEEERKRIAREIHDEMGQNLMALRIDVSMLHARTADTHPRLHGKIETVLSNIDNTIKSVRTIINNLRPAVLDLGLYTSFNWQIQEFKRRTGIACDLFAKADELDQGLTEEQTTTLFRILQESLTNVARHANAKSVNITLNRKGDQLQMRISDDGVGMYPGDRRKSKSFGLLGIRERISAIGGELTVESTIGHGTILLLSIPLEKEPSSTAGEQPRMQA